MAVTRIKNNQITDSTITFQKIVPGTLVGSLFNSNLTINSNISIIGNLEVSGNTTTIGSINTFVNDPLVIFNNGYVGVPSYDVGILVNRNLGTLGTYGGMNTAWVWSESDGAFIGVLTTETGSTTGSINRSFFANTKVGNVQSSGANVTTLQSGTLYNSGVIKSAGNIVAESGTVSNSITTGAIVVPGSGGVGIGGALYVGGTSNFVGNLTAGNIEVLGNINVVVGAVASYNGIFYGNGSTGEGALYAGTTTYTPLANTIVQVTGNIDSYAQINFQNYSSGISASTDLVLTADNGSDIDGYIDLGINSSTFNDVDYPGFYPNDGYLIMHGVTGAGNLIIMTHEDETAIKFHVGEFGEANIRAAVTNTGFRVNTITTSTTTSTGALVVDGGAGIAGNLNVGQQLQAGLASFSSINNTPIGNATASTGSFTTLSASTTATTNFSSSNVAITGGYAQGLANVRATEGQFTNFSTGNAIVQSGYADNFAIGANTKATGAFTTLTADSNVTLTSSQTSSSTASGALVVTGGVGVGGNLNVGGDIVVTGNLTVNGNTTSINVENLDVEDLLITLAKGAFNGTAADGGGIHLDGAQANITYRYSDNSWNLNKRVNANSIHTPELNASVGNVITQWATNFSSGNAWITGGYADNFVIGGNIQATGNFTTLTTINFYVGTVNSSTLNSTSGNVTTLYANNLSSTNIAVTGGYLNSLANIRATEGQFTNLSSGNAVLSGGYITNMANVYGTLGQFTNFSTGNLVGTGGYLTGLANVYSTLGQFTDISTGNAIVQSGYADNFAIGANTPATGSFTTLSASGVGTIVGNIVGASGTATNYLTSGTSGALVLTGTGGAAIGGNAYIGQAVVINAAQSVHDTFIRGVNEKSLLHVVADSAYDQVTIGGNLVQANVTQGAKLQVNSTDSMLVPVGTTAQRPGNQGFADVVGMVRYNSTFGDLEYYNGSIWRAANTAFTIITSTQFSASTGNPDGNVDGINVYFNLPATATTNGVIVTINGVVQLPTTAYSITGANLAFTEAPAIGDVIDIRSLTTTSYVNNITDSTGYNSWNTSTSNVYITTGSTSANVIRSYISNGAEVNSTPNIEIASSGIATGIDTFSIAAYSSAEYTITSTIQNTNIRDISKVLVVHDGSFAYLTLVSNICTSSNTLTTFTAIENSGNIILRGTTTNNNTVLRIRKQYQAI
jgi:hypothetical protein